VSASSSYEGWKRERERRGKESTCPVSTEGGTRRVQLVRERERRGEGERPVFSGHEHGRHVRARLVKRLHHAELPAGLDEDAARARRDVQRELPCLVLRVRRVRLVRGEGRGVST
jgi:hypothetical protein